MLILARSVDVDTAFDFVAVSSYGKGQRSSGAVKLIKDLDEPIEGKNVLIVESILDTGLTLAYLRKIFLQHKPKTLRIAALLDKPSRRIERIDADYVGFSIPNLFVIGYGMDYAERYRQFYPTSASWLPTTPNSCRVHIHSHSCVRAQPYKLRMKQSRSARSVRARLESCRRQVRKRRGLSPCLLAYNHQTHPGNNLHGQRTRNP